MAANAKSPADLKAEGEELKSLFAKVKKKQHNCAVLMAKDGLVIEAHIKKSPDILLKAGKKNGGMPKGAWGTMTMDGQVILIDPINDKIPGNLTKLAKKFFMARGLKYRLEIVEIEGGEAASEEGEPDEPETIRQAVGEENSQGSGADGSDQRDALTTRRADLQEQVEALDADRENVMNSPMNEALSGFDRAMEAEEYDRASNALDTLTVVLEDYEGLMAQKRPLIARMDALAPAIERMKNGDTSEAADQIARAVREYEYALSNNEWIGAAEKLDAIQALIGSTEEPPIGGGEPAQPNQEAPDDSKQRRTSMKNWINAQKPKINAILKKRETENAQAMAQAVTKFSKALKAGLLDEAETALDAVKAIIEKADEEFTLTDKQRSAIMKEVEDIGAEVSRLTRELSA